MQCGPWVFSCVPLPFGVARCVKPHLNLTYSWLKLTFQCTKQRSCSGLCSTREFCMTAERY